MEMKRSMFEQEAEEKESANLAQDAIFWPGKVVLGYTRKGSRIKNGIQYEIKALGPIVKLAPLAGGDEFSASLPKFFRSARLSYALMQACVQ